MSLRHTRFRGKVKLHGRPKEQAKAEIMLMAAEEKQIDRQRRRRLFTLLDFIIIISFALAIYSIYAKQYLNMFLFIIIGVIPLAYFIIRRIIKNKSKTTN